MAPVNLPKNKCSYIDKMPREIATSALADLEQRKAEPDLSPSKLESIQADEDMYKAILAAIDRVPPPTMPFNLTGYGYGRGRGDGSFGKRLHGSK